jgi:hypothetical protein
MRPSGCVAGRPIFDAMTENKDVIRARVELWNVARRCSGEEVGVDEGKYSVVDSEFEISSTRILVRA